MAKNVTQTTAPVEVTPVTEVTTTTAPATAVKPPVKAGRSFASLLNRMKGLNTEAAEAKGGKKSNKKAKGDDVAKVVPELVYGLFQSVTQPDGTVLTHQPYVAESTGKPSDVFVDKSGVGGCKGAVYVKRGNVRVTRPMARWILDEFSGHNRQQTAPAIKRYKEAMDKDNSDVSAWHHVGNTAGFVVAKPGSDRALGMCNAGHTFKAFIESGRPEILMDFYFGIPETYANLADVNIPRTAKDTIGRMHHYDQFIGTDAELDGEQLPVELKDSDIGSMSNIHSQALRIVACVQLGKKVKDSEPLSTSAIATLDAKYGKVIAACMIRLYLMDRMAMTESDKGKKIPGAIKKLVTMSHLVAVMTIAATEENEAKELIVNAEVLDAIEDMLADMVDMDNDDELVPGVALRETMKRFKLDRMNDQNIKWLVLKTCVLGQMGSPEVDYDVESLFAVESDDEVPHLDTLLDPEPEETDEDESAVDNMDEDESEDNGETEVDEGGDEEEEEIPGE